MIHSLHFSSAHPAPLSVFSYNDRYAKATIEEVKEEFHSNQQLRECLAIAEVIEDRAHSCPISVSPALSARVPLYPAQEFSFPNPNGAVENEHSQKHFPAMHYLSLGQSADNIPGNAASLCSHLSHKGESSILDASLRALHGSFAHKLQSCSVLRHEDKLKHFSSNKPSSESARCTQSLFSSSNARAQSVISYLRYHDACTPVRADPLRSIDLRVRTGRTVSSLFTKSSVSFSTLSQKREHKYTGEYAYDVDTNTFITQPPCQPYPECFINQSQECRDSAKGPLNSNKKNSSLYSKGVRPQSAAPTLEKLAPSVSNFLSGTSTRKGESCYASLQQSQLVAKSLDTSSCELPDSVHYNHSVHNNLATSPMTVSSYSSREKYKLSGSKNDDTTPTNLSHNNNEASAREKEAGRHPVRWKKLASLLCTATHKDRTARHSPSLLPELELNGILETKLSYRSTKNMSERQKDTNFYDTPGVMILMAKNIVESGSQSTANSSEHRLTAARLSESQIRNRGFADSSSSIPSSKPLATVHNLHTGKRQQYNLSTISIRGKTVMTQCANTPLHEFRMSSMNDASNTAESGARPTKISRRCHSCVPMRPKAQLLAQQKQFFPACARCSATVANLKEQPVASDSSPMIIAPKRACSTQNWRISKHSRSCTPLPKR